MLAAERESVFADFEWLKARTEHRARAETSLDQAFAVLAGT